MTDLIIKGFDSRKASRLCAVTAVAIGAAGLAGWICNIEALKRIHPTLVAIKANTTIALMLAGLSLLLLQDTNAAGVKRRLAQSCAGAIALLGLVTLAEYLFGWDASIDQLLINESPAAAGQSFPGRMGVAAALALFCLGMALLFLDTKLAGKYWAGTFAFAAASITLLVFLYYFYGIADFEPIPKYATIALHTAIAFLSLSAGIFLARPNRGIMVALFGQSVSSAVARRMLPAAVLLPVLLGWLRTLGVQAGLFGPGFGTAVLVVPFIVVFTGLIWWTVHAINREEIERKRAETVLRAEKERSEKILASITESFYALDRNYRFTYANLAAAEAFAKWRNTPESVLGNTIWEEFPQIIGTIVERQFRRAMDERISISFESYYESVRHWFRVNVFPSAEGISVFFQDITPQRRAEEAQAQLAAIVMSSRDAILSQTLEGIITTWNVGAERMFDYTAKEVIGQLVLRLIPSDLCEEEYRILARLKAGEHIEHHETVRATKDGRRLAVSLTMSPIRDPSGTIIGASEIVHDITEQKNREESLRENSRLLKAVAGNTRVGLVIVNAQYEYLFTNDAYGEVLGLPAQEIVGRRVPDVTAAGWTQIQPQLDRALAGERVSDELTLPARPDHEEGSRFFTMIYEPHIDQDGHSSVAVVVVDITERKRAEEAMRESESRYRALFTSMDEGFCIIEMIFDEQHRPVDYRFIEVNPAFEQQTGLRDARGKRMLELAPQQEQHWFDIFGKVAVTGLPVRSEEQAVALNRWYDVHAFRLQQSRRVAILFNDVTLRKHAEQQLRESEEGFRAMADNIAPLAWMANADGWIFFYNQRWYSYTGTTFEDMQGWGWEKVLHPDHLSRVLPKWKTALERGEPWEDTFPLQGIHGAYRWFLSRAFPIRDREGKIMRWFGTNTDITELLEAEELLASRAKHLEQLVEQRTAELRETVQQLETFSYSIVHDMRAPLRSMRSFATILEEGYGDRLDDEGRGYVKRIANSAGRMDALITDVLSYSRVSMKGASLNSVNLDKLIREIVDHYPQFQEAASAIHVQGPLPTVRGNAALLTQVFSNLLGNAIKFVWPGRVPYVVVRTQVDGQRVRVWVEDNGIGIPSEQRENVFGLFQRLHAADRYAGTGVGLAIVKKAVQRMGGEVGFESEPGQGSRFWVELEIAKGE